VCTGRPPKRTQRHATHTHARIQYTTTPAAVCARARKGRRRSASVFSFPQSHSIPICHRRPTRTRTHCPGPSDANRSHSVTQKSYFLSPGRAETDPRPLYNNIFEADSNFLRVFTVFFSFRPSLARARARVR